MKSGERGRPFGECQPVSLEGRRFVDGRKVFSERKDGSLFADLTGEFSIVSRRSEPALRMSLPVMRVMMDVEIMMFVITGRTWFSVRFMM